MGGRGTEGFEELGHEIEVVTGGIQELALLRKLPHSPSALDDTKEGTETNLL